MEWMKHNIATICMAFGLFAAAFVLASWGVGYYANALFGMKFEIGSCWQGISAVGVGLVGLFKWLCDSKLNSDPGQMPGVKERE